MILRIILRTLLLVSCATIFLKITYELIINYHYKKVVVCASDEPVESKINMPIIAICAQNPFRGEIKPLYTRDDYMSNAINSTQDILIDVQIYGRDDGSQKSKVEYLKKRNNLLDIEDLLTKDGHCSMVKFKEKVTSYDDNFYEPSKLLDRNDNVRVSTSEECKKHEIIEFIFKV